MRYSLRAAVSDDDEWSFRLHQEAMGDVVAQVFGEWDEAVQRGMHHDWFDPHRLRVIEVDGQRVGVLDLQEHPDHHYLARIELEHRHRASGLGGAVLSDLLSRADELGVPVRLDVFSVNRAVGLYERLGFRQLTEDGHRVRMERLPQ